MRTALLAISALACQDYDVDSVYGVLTVEPDSVVAGPLAEDEPLEATLLLRAFEDDVRIRNVEPYGVGLELDPDPDDGTLLRDGESATVGLFWAGLPPGEWDGWVTVDADAREGSHLVVTIEVEVGGGE